MNRLFAAICLTLLPISFLNAAASINSELENCAAIKRDLLRLNCYDQLSSQAGSFNEQPLPPMNHVAVGNTAANTSAVAATTANQSTATGNTANTNVGESNSSRSPTNSFGLKTQPSDLDEIKSHIVGQFSGWKKGDKIKLANGQVWKITDSSNTLHHRATNPKITISKGAFDSYRISVDGLNKDALVKRVK
ncbi:MAG: hypothetical protein DRQ47_11000 [Gammaproteobacteria bacterium]|nr:MAG: hypothetical protein DRQ47_11000 [Gammaproteobacteria bacterium]